MLNATIIYEKLMRRGLMLLGARRRLVRLDSGQRAHLLDIQGTGELPPLVLVHGYSACGATQYAGLVRLLKTRFSRIVVPDLLGHGESTAPTDLTGEIMLDGLTGALDVALLSAPRAIMFASSLAGGLAVRYVHRRPRALRGLVLCSPSGAPLTGPQLDQVIRRLTIRSHAEALAFVDGLFPGGHLFRQIYAWGVRQQFSRPHLLKLLERAGEERFLSPAELHSLPVPVQLIWGRQDHLLPWEHCEFFRRHLPDNTLVETPEDWGHAPFLDHGAELAERLVSFSRRLVMTRPQRSSAPAATARSVPPPAQSSSRARQRGLGGELRARWATPSIRPRDGIRS